MNQVDSIVQAGANQPPVAMSIAGSDPGAGAGAQVDLKTFSAHGVFGVTAISAVTVQNTCEVRSVHIVPPHIVGEQIRCLVDDFNIISAKTGMLATRETIEIVGNAMVHSGIPHWVIDPVLVSSSGSPLLENGAHESYLA
ncbi:MAG TPA: bifunctional hydroxymethylpyrimidine kinase/phosphomethylpyrimidine kinase, partial [Acidimicrobiales bacterium]|nr:bifunctional hydroxymethylpyrimidine kinase/phosphomethylpyrimidine kinase [Acidimicrobiales bacterium]